MRQVTVRSSAARPGVLLAGLLLGALGAFAQEHPVPAVPPTPPVPSVPSVPSAPPEISIRGFHVKAGQTHKGDVVKIAPSVNIEGTLDGDMYVTSETVRISGVVTGDVFVAGRQVDVTGEVQKSLRCAGANVVLDGKVGGSLFVTGGALTLGSKAHVVENVTAFAGRLMHHGVIDENLTFTGGSAVLGGKILDDAELTADSIEIEPGARIEGDVTYSTRRQMDDEMQAITGGDVAFDEKPVKHAKKRHDDDDEDEAVFDKPSTFGIGVRIAFFMASFLFGCALLALFRQHEPRVNDAIGNDGLRSAGLGFVSVLATIAVCLSAILIITIPFILIYLLAYLFAIYLAKIPVAVYTGRKLLGLIHRTTGPYAALFVGLVALHLLFMIPILGALAWCAVALLGLGAVISVYIAHREARKAALATPVPEAPAAAS
jgi:cytoskeletal protein CcmA (bactofilin family)